MLKYLSIDKLSSIQREFLNFISPDKFEELLGLSYDKYSTEDILYNCPSLGSVLNDMGIPHDAISIGINISPPNWKAPIHIDHLAFTRVSINIPIIGCDGTYVNFYRIFSEGNFDNHRDNDRPLLFRKFEENECELISSYEVNLPYVLPLSVPHNFDNHKDTLRVMLLCRVANKSIVATDIVNKILNE